MLVRECRLNLRDSVFGGNWADHFGGALYLFGCEIEGFSDNAFVGNTVSPGVSQPMHLSRGSALYISPMRSESLDATGSVTNSVFSDNEGLPIYESDVLASDPCNCANRVTYEGNRFFNSTYEDDVYWNNLVSGSRTAEELNTLVIDRGSGDTTEKSLLDTNVGEVESIPVAELRLAPGAVLVDNSTGNSPAPTQSMLGWVWNGGCAELDGVGLDPVTERTGFFSASTGAHGLSVWSGGACSGLADISAQETVLSGPNPWTQMTVSPNVITTGESPVLSWNLYSGQLITGAISHGVMDEVTVPFGSVQVTPANTTQYHMTLMTKQGGAVNSAWVWVDEDPPSLFLDGFETGDFSMWSVSVP